MHHQMGVGDGFMDFSDTADRKHFTRGLTGELVGTVACTDGDGQGIHLGLGDEISSLCGIGQQLILGKLTFKTVAVLGFAFTGFKGSKAT